MARSRVPETDQGIEGELTVEMYDRMQRRLRDRSWIETDDVIKSGITGGLALEIGPGPGYLGLDWLGKTCDSSLTGLDISQDMVALARRNAHACGFGARTEYVCGSAATLPFGRRVVRLRVHCEFAARVERT